MNLTDSTMHRIHHCHHHQAQIREQVSLSNFLRLLQTKPIPITPPFTSWRVQQMREREKATSVEKLQGRRSRFLPNRGSCRRISAAPRDLGSAASIIRWWQAHSSRILVQPGISCPRVGRGNPTTIITSSRCMLVTFKSWREYATGVYNTTWRII